MRPRRHAHNSQAFAVALFLLAYTRVPGAAPASCVIAWGHPNQPETTVPSGLSNIVAISAGSYNGLALRDNGTLVYWGDNVLDPVYATNAPPGMTNLAAISAGNGYNLVLRRDGQVIGWGYDDSHQAEVPPGLTDAMAIAAHSTVSLALRSNGTVVVWGAMTNAPPGLSNVTAIAAGDSHAVALRSDGTVVAWQDVVYNQPITNVPPGLSNVIAIAATGSSSLALRSDGTVVGWGLNFYGEASVPPGLSNVVEIACGEFHSLARLRDGTVVAWGAGGSGSNSWPNSAQSVVPYGLANVKAISGGYFYSLALDDGAPVLTTLPVGQTNYTGTTVFFTAEVAGLEPLSFQWQHSGTNLPGATDLALTLTNVQLADAGAYTLSVSNASGSLTSPEAALVLVSSPPIIVKQPVSLAALVTSNVTFSAAAEGSLPITYQWRFQDESIVDATTATLVITNAQIAAAGPYEVVLANDYGSITSAVASLAVTPSYVVGFGSGTFSKTNHPANLTNVIAVAGGSSHSVALQENGVVVAWGGFGSGQTNVPPALTNAAAIAAGSDFCLALTADGRAVAWGDNSLHQTDVPPGLTNLVGIAAGDYHSLALKDNGTLAGWGYFYVFDRTIRVPFWIPPGISNVVAADTGSEYGLALKSNGTVLAWGYNFTPGLTNVPTWLTNVVAIAAGSYHCLALRGDGTVVAWGRNNYGQTNVPAGLSNVVAIAAGSYHSVALKDDGRVVAWGAGTNIASFPRSGQCLVPSDLEDVVAIGAGDTHTLAVRDLRPPVFHEVRPAGTNTTFSLSFLSSKQRVYSLEFKETMLQDKWTTLALVAGNGGVISLCDPYATNAQRFYRARRW